jgi:hypothetical protein
MTASCVGFPYQVLSAALYNVEPDIDPHDGNLALQFSSLNRPRRYVFPVKQALLAVILLGIGVTMTVVGVTERSIRAYCSSCHLLWSALQRD